MNTFIHSRLFQGLVLSIIILDSIVLGALTFSFLKNNSILIAIDRICLLFFCIEMCVKILVLRKEFFLSKWNLFDLCIVVLSVLPTTIIGNIAILRLFRVLRAARLSSSVPQLRFVIAVITRSIPSVVSIGVLLLLVYYIYAVLGTQLFATAAPEYFGDLGKSFFTLFQVMTGESWSGAIARPIMRIYPYAWIYFISYMIIVSFIVLNMVIGVIVDSISEIKAQKLERDNKDV
ncbi:ion transporter [Helicobacter canis]|uniref:Ion transporter n=1 Tax=Helicobacter canis TaxID=29419 RepID=A0A5M9QN73_9HELI|nr:ion transporter [Helicobacter canis]KAA8709838.1 ion transporter [Helicobacter canis]